MARDMAGSDEAHSRNFHSFNEGRTAAFADTGESLRVKLTLQI